MLYIDLWHRFIEEFSAAIHRESAVSHLASVWSSHKARTKFYREMLKQLAMGFGTVIEEELETGNELFKLRDLSEFGWRASAISTAAS
jgi:hypothetical protein